ncbi:hypothetical protein [Nocardia cyriacigeorgica]|uniref:hypothetical protein n=1 Tax=Nocardia cyriacigeorgica TaxID=135487 RepID=UPI00189569C2|nr:hypothetical protein [Nocardia cyriacigeorgica]MBF6435494.1 hypothetical protein [Nocardia cyriacigeorgica]MBF6454427.1 hypothetical protein [Nocardia cyriacigeorgica]MBF6478093.1 hypothetical protein [Nocardia cyriacigeorgica]MBF6552321.1 hypothetical protein [Nocardia cyriacigeorgica]
MKPLAYGYLRLDVAGESIGECERRIQQFVERQGYDLGMVFHERTYGCAALDALIAELRRAQCRNVVVPDIEHLIRQTALRQAVETRLWCEASAGVLVARMAGDLDRESVGVIR